MHTKPVYFCPDCKMPVLTQANASEEEAEARIEFHEYIVHGIGDRRTPLVRSINTLEEL